MSHTSAVRTSTRWTHNPTTLGLVLAVAAAVGIVVDRPTPSAGTSNVEPSHMAVGVSLGSSPLRTLPSGGRVPGGPPGGAIGEDDGALPDGVTVFDDRYPGVGNLGPDLLSALRAAAKAAGADGVELVVNSGWRSPDYQDRLLRDAVATYGSEREAARWVATAETSPHVAGQAVDIGPAAAAAWLSERGAAFGLCQIYANEPWHYELRPQAIEGRCPRMYADPRQDPRLED